MAVIILAGGTGMVGRKLQQLLSARNHEVRVLTRNPKTSIEYKWDIEQHYIDISVFENADILINLAGANVGAQRWTDAYKKEIINSRVLSAGLLHDALFTHQLSVKHYISASAVGFYGHRPNVFLQEDDSNGTGFLAAVCNQWEKAAMKMEDLKIPVTILRIGVVLSATDGALSKMSMSNKFGIGSILGDGNQHISWLHLDDLCRMIMHVIQNNCYGVYNATAPNPVTYRQLSEAISESMHTKHIPISVPEFAIKMLLGEQAEMVLADTRCSAQKMSDSGFAFLFQSVDTALQDIFKNK